MSVFCAQMNIPERKGKHFKFKYLQYKRLNQFVLLQCVRLSVLQACPMDIINLHNLCQLNETAMMSEEICFN